MKDEFLTISEVSKLVGVTPNRIRVYEQEGVVSPQRVGNTNHPIRLFTGSDVAALKRHRQKINRGR